MNILVLNYEFPPLGGGAAPVAYDICKMLAERGHYIQVVTMGLGRLKKDEVLDGIHIHRVPCLRKKMNVCHPWEQLSYILSASYYLRKHLRSSNYDICHTHFIIPTGIIALYLKNKFHLNYVITAHGSDVIGHNNKRFGLLYQLIKKPWISILKHAELITTPSRYLEEKINDTCPLRNAEVIPNGIFTHEYKNLKPGKNKYILTMSRLQETKGIQTVITAFSKTKHDGWKLVIAGDGPYKEVLMGLVRELKLESCVVFTGWVKKGSEEHLKLLGEAAIFVSASWFESQSISVVEAMASGCNILVSDIPAHRELLEERYLCSENELPARLQSAMETKPVRAEFNLFQYDWENIIGKYERILIAASSDKLQ